MSTTNPTAGTVGAPAVPLPRYVEVETSRRCNRTCAWCPNGEHSGRREQELMDWPLFEGLLRELADLRFGGWLAFHNYNEPLLNPRLDDELAAVRVVLPAARPAIYTNGDVLTAARLDQLLDAGVQAVRVTLYPHDPRTPASERTVQRWIDRAGAAGRPWTRGPVRQGWAAVWRDAGRRVEVISPDITGTYNSRGGSVTVLPLAAVRRVEPCLMTATSASIDYRGRLKMCCCVYPEPGVGHDQYVVGALADATFAQLWSSAQMTAYQTAHATADWSLSPACASCSQQLPENRR